VFIIVLMAVILALCGGIAVYVAFPHRGEELPGVPWLGDAISRAADAVPIVEEEGTNVSAFADRW
jgi:hypothetical protein